MPVMNGAEAAVHLKRTMPQMKIVLFTMHSDNIGKALAAAVGIDLALSKQDGLLKLDEHLNALLIPETTPVKTDAIEIEMRRFGSPNCLRNHSNKAA
jgi:DNA-binding NarL/FixJ family response regulator